MPEMPDTIETHLQIGTNNVSITFGWDGGETIQVVLDQTRLLSLISRLHGKIERNPLTPISLERLRPGATITVQGVSSRREPDGSLQLELIAVFEDRLVTVPFSLSPEGVHDLAKQLKGI